MFSLEQYAAAQESAVMTEAPRGTIELTGADRRLFLHALLTNDIATLEKGTGAYAAYLTPQGRMISDMRVIETGERMLLDVEAALAAPLAERFNALIFSEDVQVADVSAEVCVVGVHGPRAADVVERATGMAATDLASQYSNLSGPLTVLRDDGLGVPGFDIYVARADCESLRRKLGQAGAVPASDETIEALRIEAGRPRFGADMKTDTIPLEAGIENRAISFTKGCYVGQEVIVRVMHRGHGRVARRLVRLVLPGSAVPNRGAKIFAGDQQVGEITSAAESPKAGAPVAMGYVHRDYAAPGTELIVNGSKGRVHQPGD
jgi:folate-binding protein YgfZ